MPFVSDEFVTNAKALAEGVPQLQEKLAAEAPQVEKTAEALQPLAEATVDTLISQGLIPANEKAAAMDRLLDHGEAIQALNKTAQLVRHESMGESEKVAANVNVPFAGTRGDETRESDRMLLNRLGFQ